MVAWQFDAKLWLMPCQGPHPGQAAIEPSRETCVVLWLLVTVAERDVLCSVVRQGGRYHQVLTAPIAHVDAAPLLALSSARGPPCGAAGLLCPAPLNSLRARSRLEMAAPHPPQTVQYHSKESFGPSPWTIRSMHLVMGPNSSCIQY